LKWLNCVLVIVLALVQFQLWYGHGGLLELRQIDRDVDMQRAENIRLRERNASLAAEVMDLKQGMESIEERARSDMGMVKANEQFFQIIQRDR
jgi:cell division protein FtsB